MSKAVNSPTALLLQSSRLFSLPRPLPELSDRSTGGTTRGSDSGTTPYPTHQAITTPASSLHRGDFGLKRSLPGKRTRHTSTPHIRVQAHDTYAHVTDFASAADHTQTLEKWQEMGIPMVLRQSQEFGLSNRRGLHLSVYESWVDNTDPEPGLNLRAKGLPPTGNKSAEPNTRIRWKHAGPWIAGMQQGEFDAYLSRQIATRRPEWRALLARKLVKNKVASAIGNARDLGETMDKTAVENLRNTYRPTEEEITEYQKSLRDEHMAAAEALSTDLTTYICEFLDLPAVTADTASGPDLMKTLSVDTTDEGPPSTHPGAGLSHIRTNAVMHNHPIYGPQLHPPPVESRVLKPRMFRYNSKVSYKAKLGVGGVVTYDSDSLTRSTGRRLESVDEADQLATELDPDLVGGNKIWVHPSTAYVGPNGHVMLNIRKRADAEAMAVKKGDVEDIYARKRATANLPAPEPGVQDPRPLATRARAKYGFATGHGRRGESSPTGMEGFDGEVQRREDGGASMRHVQDLLNQGSNSKS